GDRVEKLLLALVVVIGALELDRAGRDGRNERFLEAVRTKRRFEVGKVGLEGRLSSVGDGSRAHRVDHLELRLARRGRRVLRAALDLAIRVREPFFVSAA